MTRRRTATEQNRRVARELMATVAVKELKEFAKVVADLQALAETAEVTAEQVLDAFAAVRAHRAVLDRRLDALLGLAVLEGVPVREVARTTGIPPRTLTRRLAGTPAAWVGQTLHPAPYSAWGWSAGS
ncbi:hypothetical protein [Mycobacteroides abscessus]|uniref:hypothetical protein n=1 Tax=Mycobacteroides abscessus TaxID=36809 RepID=UPI0005DEC582|nr:hypothetical protein [Mycobacteroides abscessus]CPR70079.1 Uncharacterised protein [Mycobacteroides abscessus]CPU70441.1 Uncharacterised protein [Mycobacteroides abscessus]